MYICTYPWNPWPPRRGTARPSRPAWPGGGGPGTLIIHTWKNSLDWTSLNLLKFAIFTRQNVVAVVVVTVCWSYRCLCKKTLLWRRRHVGVSALFTTMASTEPLNGTIWGVTSCFLPSLSHFSQKWGGETKVTQNFVPFSKNNLPT